MRTTVRLNEELLAAARQLAVETNRSLTTVIEDALREVVCRRKIASSQANELKFPIFNGQGLKPGIDLDHSPALLDIMDDLP